MGEKEYIERGAVIRFVKQNTPNIHGDTTMRCVERALKAAPATADVVSCEVFEQVKWERDIAMQQLEEHGIPFCGKADDVVDVRHGEWIRKDWFLVCSECDVTKPYVVLNDTIHYWRCDYCNRCGAKMDGEREEKT